MKGIKPSLRVGACAGLFALCACAESITTSPDGLRSSTLASASNVVYSVYPARTLVSSAAIVGGELRTQRFDDGGHNTGLERLWPLSDLARFQWEGNRVGLLTNPGVLYARDRVSEWVPIASDVADFQLEGDRIAALHNDGRLRVKEGISGPWTTVATEVRAFQLESNRIAALHDDGLLRVKDGINAAWASVATGVSQFQLEGNSIGIVQPRNKQQGDDEDGDDEEENEGGDATQPARGTLLIKDGIFGPWTEVATKVSRFQLEGRRIGFLHTGRGHQHDYDSNEADDYAAEAERGTMTLEVRDGVNGAWTRLASGVIEFQLEGDRIGVLQKKGIVRARDGINGTWIELARDAMAFQLQNSAIGVLSADGLRVRENINSGWKLLRGSFAGATQIRLLVDVPLVFRSTPETYQEQANKCDAEFAQGKDADGYYRCYPEYRFGVIVGKYGRFCGAGVPSDGNWDWAHGEGVIDPVDGLCREHDHGAGWYGIDPIDFRYGACVVRYGYEHDRLTVDGVKVSEGTPAWDAAWALMPRTHDARTAWWQESSGPEACNQDRLDQFTAATASRL